jgi:hypothetical protein
VAVVVVDVKAMDVVGVEVMILVAVVVVDVNLAMDVVGVEVMIVFVLGPGLEHLGELLLSR